MANRSTDFRQKEVISISEGKRLGYISDVEIDFENGKIDSVIIPGPSRFFGLFGSAEDTHIPWSSIYKIGDDLILVK
ncbi:MAG: YlmC/YmxH family sporulation protein [Oscillospiraceae bacterium]|nr:YlmC/YmxH family sporulation protein [Oscillospiraceae bacterium]